MITRFAIPSLLIGYCVGVIAGEFSFFSTEIIVAALGSCFLLGLLFLFSFYRRSDAHCAVLLFIVFFGIVLGGLRMQFQERKEIVTCASSCLVSGKVVRLGDRKDTYQIVDVSIQEKNAYVRVTLPLYPEYEIGDTLLLTGKIQEPAHVFPHGGVKHFDYGSYLFLQGVGSVMYYPKVDVASSSDVMFRESLLRLTSVLSQRVSQYVRDPAAHLMSGILLGVSSLGERVQTMFRTTGLSHIIVLSGFNITILITFILFVFAWVPLFVRIFLAIGAVIIFVIATGGESSLLRASIMATVSLLALLVGRGYVASLALFVSLFVLLLIEPYSLFYDVSLHLSFLATAGIVYGYDIVKKYCSTFSKPFFAELMSATFCAYIVTLPYILYTFEALSLYAIIVNCLIVPLVPFAMLITFFVIITSFINEHTASLFGYVCTFLGNLIIGVASFFSTLPFASIKVSISITEMVVLYSGVIFLYLFLKTKVVSINDETHETKEGEIISSVMRF